MMVQLGCLNEKKTGSDDEKEIHENAGTIFKTKLKWSNILAICLLHSITLYGLITFPYTQKCATLLFLIVIGSISGFGVTAAAHRLWCHKAYKAKTPLKVLLVIFYTMAGQNSIYDWVRDHRVHHKYSETLADPHDSNRGFFFSHVGWLMLKKHPEVLKKGRQIDMNDVLSDPVVKIHLKYFLLTKLLFCFVLPISIPCYFWGETIFYSVLSNLSRYCIVLNFTWLVNSAAHLYGTRPYNKNIEPRENFMVSVLAMGEGWHNYHHSFPWDYRAGELGKWNVTTFWINLFQKLGLAYDLKSPSSDLVRNVIEKCGDGTYKWGHEISEDVGEETPS